MTAAPAGRVIICGFDGATYSLLEPLIGHGVMPNLATAMKEGAWGDCRSTMPAVTAPAWTTCVTGVNPGKHGVFSFFGRDPQTLKPRYLSSAAVRVPTLWQRLSRAGRTVGVVNVPTTYPPEELNGYMVTGFLTPKGRDYARPAELQTELEREGYRISAPLPHRGAIPEPLAQRWLTELRDVTNRRTETVLRQQDRFDPDFSMVVYMTPDLIQHPFYKFLDPDEPLSRSEKADNLRPYIHRCYEALDDALGALRSTLRPSDLMLVCSDHGFAPLDGRVYMNRWLAQEGFLKTNKLAVASYESSRIVRGKLKTKFPRLRTRWGGAEAVQETYIDRDGSVAYSGEPIEFAIHGLTPNAPLDEIAERVKTIRHPATGEPLVEEVFRREQCYSGPWVQDAPELLLLMTEDRYGLNNRLWGRRPGIYVPKPGPVGIHARSGIILALGDLVSSRTRLSCELQDVAPTVLYALGEAIPGYADGRVLEELFSPRLLADNPVRIDDSETMVTHQDSAAYSTDEEEEIAGRLADLGYIE